MYGNGEGVIYDYIRAHMWLSIAASNGSDSALKDLGIVVKWMTPGEKEAAQRLARECVAKNYKGC